MLRLGVPSRRNWNFRPSELRSSVVTIKIVYSPRLATREVFCSGAVDEPYLVRMH